MYMWKEDSTKDKYCSHAYKHTITNYRYRMFSVSWNDIASYPGLPRTRENKQRKVKLFRECGEGLGTRLGRVYGVANTSRLASYIICKGSYASPTSSKTERAPLGLP